MAHYLTTVQTAWSLEQAFDNLAEFSNVADWDPGVSDASNLSPEPLELGARFRVIASFAGREIELVYETIEFERPNRVTLRATTNTVTSLDTLTFEPGPGGGTAVTYDADLSLSGPLKLFDPLMGFAFRRIGDKARDGLAERLSGRAPLPR